MLQETAIVSKDSLATKTKILRNRDHWLGLLLELRLDLELPRHRDRDLLLSALAVDFATLNHRIYGLGS